MKHRELIDPRNFVYQNVGKERKDIYWDLPDGDQEVQFEIRADRKFRLYLRCGDADNELLIPLGMGDQFVHQMRVRDIKGIYAEFDSPTHVASKIRYKPVKIHEKPWGEPVVVITDEEEPTDIKALIAREMAYMLEEKQGPDEEEDYFTGLDDEEEWTDADEEFGEGLMEPDPDVAYERMRATRNRRKNTDRMGDHDNDTNVDHQTEPDPEPSPEPDTPDPEKQRTIIERVRQVIDNG